MFSVTLESARFSSSSLFRKSEAAEALIKVLQFPEKNRVFKFWYILILNTSACVFKFLIVQKGDLGVFG